MRFQVLFHENKNTILILLEKVINNYINFLDKNGIIYKH